MWRAMGSRKGAKPPTINSSGAWHEQRNQLRSDHRETAAIQTTEFVHLDLGAVGRSSLVFRTTSHLLEKHLLPYGNFIWLSSIKYCACNFHLLKESHDSKDFQVVSGPNFHWDYMLWHRAHRIFQIPRSQITIDHRPMVCLAYCNCQINFQIPGHES